MVKYIIFWDIFLCVLLILSNEDDHVLFDNDDNKRWDITTAKPAGQTTF